MSCWTTAGAVGYEVGKHIDNSDGKTTYVNTTIVKTDEKSSDGDIKILIAVLIGLAILSVVAWAIKIFLLEIKAQRLESIDLGRCERNRRSSSSV